MATPIRIQLRRTKGWRMPANTVKVCRGTSWGNPFNATQSMIAMLHGTAGPGVPLVALHEPPSLGRCLDLYTAWLRGQLDRDHQFLAPLHGKNLACWCKPDELCHADVLLRLANHPA